MDKLKKYMAAILPFLAAYGVQIMFAMGFMFLYGLIIGYQMVTSGITDVNIIVETIYNRVVTELALPISAFTAIVSFVIFGLWYKRICVSEEKQGGKSNLNPGVIGGLVLLGLGLQISLSFIINLIAALKPEWFIEYGEVMDQLGMGNSIISVIYIGFIAPFSEEFIFRGVIFKKARKAMPYVAANILQALMFGIYHGVLIQGIYAFLLGMFLGLVCYKKQTIFAAVCLHMVINISGLLLGYVDTTSFFFSSEFVYLIPVVGVGALLCGMVILLKKDKPSEELY